MNETYYLSIVSILAIVIALVIIDPNVGTWIDLQIQLFNINIKRYCMMATMYPRLKYEQWKIMMELKKIRKDFNMPEKDDHEDV